MKRVLHVYSTYERARFAFNEFIRTNDPNSVSLSYTYYNLTIQADDTQHQFMPCNDIEVRIKGLNYDRVFFDEHAQLEDHTKALIKSRIRS